MDICQKLAVIIFVVQLYSCINTISAQGSQPKALVCYYNSESYFREGMPFEPSKIDPTLCTHIIYSFFGMRDSNYNVYSRNPQLDLGEGETEPYPDDPENSQGELDMLRKTVDLRNDNPLLKILTSIGGPAQSSRSFSNMARHIANRTLFIRSVMKHVEMFELDGIDLSWQYPGNIEDGGRPEDRETFVVVMRELRAAFTNLTTFTDRNYTITVTAACTKNLTDVGYDVQGLGNNVDFFHLFCFDFKMYTEATPLIGHHSPLFHKESEPLQDQQLNAAFGVNYFLQLLGSASSTKLVLGVSTHARTYELEASDWTDFYQPSQGLGRPGNYTGRQGFLAFFEICDEVMKSNATNWEFRYSHEYKVPSLVNVMDLRWIGYDNEISAQEKVDFAMSKNLGGIFVDFIDLDDYNNICQGWIPYPITGAIKERLKYWENKVKV